VPAEAKVDYKYVRDESFIEKRGHLTVRARRKGALRSLPMLDIG
jgi:hypothetical protein